MANVLTQQYSGVGRIANLTNTVFYLYDESIGESGILRAAEPGDFAGGGGGGGGDASAANQVVGNNLLGNISGQLNSGIDVNGPLTNAELRATAVPVSITGVSTAANQTTTNNNLGATNSTSVTDPSATASINALLKGVLTYLSGIQPATSAETVTPSDVTNLSQTSRAIYVGYSGDVSVQINGQTVVFPNVPNAHQLDIRATRVNATDTTASGIVAMF